MFKFSINYLISTQLATSNVSFGSISSGDINYCIEIHVDSHEHFVHKLWRFIKGNQWFKGRATSPLSSIQPLIKLFASGHAFPCEGNTLHIGIFFLLFFLLILVRVILKYLVHRIYIVKNFFYVLILFRIINYCLVGN